MTDLVVIDTGKEKLELTKADVKNHLVKGQNITDSEILIFMNLCKYRNLNPWINEAYLIKYGNTSQMIVSKDVFIKKANANEKCEGWNAGVTVIYKDKDGEIKEKNKDGTIVLSNEKLVGGWIEVYIKGHRKPHLTTVQLSEYIKPGNNGKKTTWDTMSHTMIRKVAIVAGLRECFTEELAGLYLQEEINESAPEENIYENDNMKHPDSMPVIPDDKKILPNFE